jgi:molybdopterin molybdotransferase
MIEYREALDEVLSRAKTLGTVQVFLNDAVWQVLAEDIFAKEDIPFSDNSAMDGFAVRFDDIKQASPEKPAVLKLKGEVPAGKPFDGEIGKGEAVSIFTGGIVPAGADTVVELEVTEVRDGNVYIFNSREPGANIRKRGEDVRSGDLLFKRGTVITPAVCGVLASVGKPAVYVYRKPVVSIISTGTELIDIAEPLYPGAVRNSNTYLLYALLSNLPVEVFNFGVIADEPENVREAIEKALDVSDIILTTGGVSVGDYDLVKVTVEELGAKRVFWRVAQKPGKPLAFYELNRRVIFGLPGNPAAVEICFLEYVRPFILKTLGYDRYLPIRLSAKLKGGLKKKKGRLNFIRVILKEENGELVAEKAGAQGSGVLSTSARANAVALIPAEAEEVLDGEKVEVHYFENRGW